VLAAGRGTRIGGPKALLAWPLLPQRWLVPLAAAHVEARTESDRVVVVTRKDIALKLREHAASSFGGEARGELIISEEDDSLGPAGSIAAAVKQLTLTGFVVLTPVDCPPAKVSTVETMLRALRASPLATAAKPRHAGRGGHPVVVRASLLSVYAVAPRPLRDVLRAAGDSVLRVEVDDPAIGFDIDDAEALATWGRLFAGSAVGQPVFFE